VVVRASVENGGEEGLAKVEMSVGEKKETRWVWMKAGEKQDVVFSGLGEMGAGRYEIRCGEARGEVVVE
jgi:hypothetical protein